MRIDPKLVEDCARQRPLLSHVERFKLVSLLIKGGLTDEQILQVLKWISEELDNRMTRYQIRIIREKGYWR